MKEKFVVIIQGPIRINPKIIEKKWNGFDLIWSTWDNENINSDFPVLYNSKPFNNGVKNIASQQISTLNGILKAKEMGYNTCLKWRSDMYPTDANKLISLFKKNKINVMYWHNYEKGYYVDYFMSGNIDDMISIWDFNPLQRISYPEEIITNQILKLNIIPNCIGDDLTKDNNIFWEKNEKIVDLSTYKHDKLFTKIKI